MQNPNQNTNSYNDDFDKKFKQFKQEEDDSEHWVKKFADGLITDEDLSSADLKEQKLIVGDWWHEGDLGYIYGARGLGKTWLSMLLAKGLALKTKAGPWDVYDEHKVLYLDGENAAKEMKKRTTMLGKPTENLVYATHQILFERINGVMNIADIELQTAIYDYCVASSVDIVFLDNLSCLATGIDENAGGDHEKLLPWLLQLRRANISVAFVHHAGRGGKMRGHSKREDAAAWIIKLIGATGDEQHGAQFTTTFEKYRGCENQPKSYEWCFRQVNGELDLIVKELGNLAVFRELVESGLESCTDIAEEMGFSKAYVCKLAKRAESEGWLTITKGRYNIKRPDQPF